MLPFYDVDVNFNLGDGMEHRAIAEGLFTFGPEPRLIAGRCEHCGVVTFPRQAGCPRCTQRNVRDHLLSDEGRLWSWTVQRFRPKPPYIGPEEFEPYGVGYVEFDGECIVEGRLTVADPELLEIGMPMRVTLIENHRDPAGISVMTYGFRPQEAAK